MLWSRSRSSGPVSYTHLIGGGSDANILAGHGYRSVILGLGMKDVHTTDESLDMNEVLKCTKIMRRIMSMEEAE